jgi:hypothetical protein
MTRDEWIAEFARKVGLPPPDPQQVGAILRLAAIAAHASERTAAPVACWIAGVSGRSLEDLCAAAETVEAGGG